MTSSEEAHILTCHQFPRWSTSITRPRSSLPSKDAHDMFQLGIDNRSQQIERSASLSMPSGPTPHIIRHRVRIPLASRISSPLLHQPSSSPEILSVIDRSSPTLITARPFRSTPIRLKSTTLTVPQASPDTSLQNFPKQTHERRKIAQNRKRRKQQAQSLAEKYAETETWFQLRQSLAELKRLASTQQIVVDPSLSLFNCDGYSFEALKQAMIEQQELNKISMFKSESVGVSSSCDSTLSSNFQTRSNTTILQHRPSSNLPSMRRATVTYERPTFEPLVVASKPIHPLLITGNHQQLKAREKRYERSPSAPPRPRSLRPPSPAAPVAEQSAQLLASDLANDDELVLPSTPPRPVIPEEPESPSRRFAPPPPARPRPPSSVTLSSNIKPQIARCRSAMEAKSHSNKHLPRFILIADQEHRIESWYHQYPFILSDDLLQAFQSSQQKPTVPAFFTDDLQFSHHNSNSTKNFLQGKPFHTQNDWRKYDLILISNNIQEQIMHYLQTFIHLIGSLGEKKIRIYSINHEEDLKVQVRGICRNMQQQNM